jgi:hypothetical protein
MEAADTTAAVGSSRLAHKRKHNELVQPSPIKTSLSSPPLPPPTRPKEYHQAQKTHRRHASHTERASAGFTAYPLGIALFAAWLLAVFAVLSFDVVLDVFQRQLTLPDPPAIPCPLLVCADAGIHLFLTFLVALLGRLTKRRFQFFQPFVGGDAFVVLQLAGYGLVYVTTVVRAVLLSQRQERYGAYTVLGVFAVLGHSLLLWSLSFFQTPPSSASQRAATTLLSGGTAQGWCARLANTPQREIAWIVLCCGAVVFSSTIAEYHPTYRSINVVVIICFVLASLLTIQYVVVPAWLARHFYHVVLPVVLQSPAMFVLQVFGNGLLFMTFYGELVLFNAQQNAPPSWHLCCGLMAVMAIGAHLVLVHQLHAWAVVEDEDETEKAEATMVTESASRPPSVVLGSGNTGATTASAPPPQPQQTHGEPKPAQAASPTSSLIRDGYRSELGTYGPLLPSLFSVVLCVILIGTLYVSSTSANRLSVYAQQGLVQTEVLLVVLLFVQPLITHPMGAFLYGKAYRIWQPFEGTPDFILLQCLGWLFYGLAIFFAVLHLNEDGHYNFLLLLMAFLVLSQFLIHMSVVRFGRNGVTASASTTGITAGSTAAEPHERSTAGKGNKEEEAATSGDENSMSNDRAYSRSPARREGTSSEETSSSSLRRTPFLERGKGEAAETALPRVDVTAGGKTPGFLTDAGNKSGNGDTLLGATAQSSFDSVASPPSANSGVYNANANHNSSLLLSTVVNGELLLSIVLIGVSLVLRIVVIVAAFLQSVSAENASETPGGVSHAASSSSPSSRLSAVQVPATAIIIAATFFSVMATPVVQWSMRRCVRLLGPLSHAYVALATLGWGTYLLLLSRFLVLWSLLGTERVSATSPIVRVGLSCFLPSSEFSSWLQQSCKSAVVELQIPYTSGAALSLTAAFEGAVEGFVWCFPFLCLLAGNLLQTDAFLREAATKEQVQRAVSSVLVLFHEQQSTGDSQTIHTASASSFTPCRRGPDARLARLLRTIAGPRAAAAVTAVTAEVENAPFGSEGGVVSDSGGGEDTADLKAVHDAARYMTITLCCATSAAFFSAAFLADAQPIMTLGFGAVGTATLGLSCAALHYVYGTRVHSGTRPLDSKSEFAPLVPVYTFFMPFVGGPTFVVLQAVGWISFTCVASLMIACALEGKGTASIFVTMAALSVVAQVALWRSVCYFDESKVLERGFLQRNAEGLLAALSVVATVSFCRLYDMAEQGRATAHVVSSMVPVVVCSVAVFLTVPLGLVSLQRQAELYGLGSFAAWFAQDDDEDVDDEVVGALAAEVGREELAEHEARAGGEAGEECSRLHSRNPSSAVGAGDSTMGSPLSSGGLASPGMQHSIYSRANTENLLSPMLATPKMVRGRRWVTAAKRSSTRRRSLVAVVLYLVSTVLAMLTLVVLPFALVFLGYAYCTQRATVIYSVAVRAVEVLLCCFTALVVLPMIVVPVLGRSSVLRNVHSAFCCWALYNIPTYTVLGGISTPFIYNCRGTYLFTINMCSMALLSNLPYMPVAMSIFSIGSFVYFLKYHFYDGVYIHKHALEPTQCVVDLVIAVFWLFYQRRYHGRPEITGRLQSRRATRFFQQYFFRGLAYYFSVRVIVSDGYVLPQEEPYVKDASELPRVDLSKPENQYMFSFHPHGVFPGTSIVIPKTEIWEKAVGRCKEHFVSTHCADIIFNVPLMREFPMCLGAMSVSRRGIESSLRQGNSPLIVTGGQSEMLLTRMTDYEMHVVCHHIGFIRMAIKHHVPLVPVISFSESNVLDNVHCIRIQRWFLNRIAFPFPTLPIGRWYLPLPTTKPVTIVVGQPISPLPGHDNPDDPAHVEELRLRYFEHLEVLFYKYRAEANYPEMELYLHNGIYNPGVRGTASVSTPLMKGGKSQQRTTSLSVEMFDSAVRKAFSMSPEEK